MPLPPTTPSTAGFDSVADSPMANGMMRSVRQWWRPPRALRERPGERRVTFLELFYDLVYVVVIAQLSHHLAHDISGVAIGEFAFLFALVWWAWVNGAMYHDLHGHNDIRTRVFTFIQMFSVAAMAVFAGDATGSGSMGFALAYAGFHLVLTFLWWRTGVYDRSHRPISAVYSLVFLVTTVLFASTALMPAPWRIRVWALALVLDLFLPLFLFFVIRRGHTAQLTEVTASAAERFGLFTIIVLGEVIVGVVGGVLEHSHLSWQVGGTAALGMVIAVGIWWVYFDFVSNRLPRANRVSTLAWTYLHLPVTIGIASVGAALLNVVEHGQHALPDAVHWLLVGAIASTLLGIALLMWVMHLSEDELRGYRRAKHIVLLAGIVAAALGFVRLDTPTVLAILAVLLLVPAAMVFLLKPSGAASENHT
ncbi:MAG: low temperature requirement protein A [Caldilineaceae bacterium SB0665_bin_21]|nr:low temperature requirement protein A [Caldilineaceae bacterium SB0665_bin_21]